MAVLSKDLRKAAIMEVKKLVDLLGWHRSGIFLVSNRTLNNRTSYITGNRGYIYHCTIRGTNTTTNHQILNSFN